jgi:2-C-methyl-D-erythritol 4-phosphate cytidylyltransferase
MFKDQFVSAVIPAAGVGTRMKTKEKKQYIAVNGKEILAWTLQHLYESQVIDEFVIVVGEAELETIEHKVRSWLPTADIKVIVGGMTRDESVYEGLKSCHTASTYVFIHDGVRPFVQGRWLLEMLQQFDLEALDGIALGQPMTNTVKRVDGSGQIMAHVDRSNLWMIETPQLFRTREILMAHQSKTDLTEKITDDTQLLMAAGKRIKLMAHSGMNEKITTPAELELAKAFLK